MLFESKQLTPAREDKKCTWLSLSAFRPPPAAGLFQTLENSFRKRNLIFSSAFLIICIARIIFRIF